MSSRLECKVGQNQPFSYIIGIWKNNTKFFILENVPSIKLIPISMLFWHSLNDFLVYTYQLIWKQTRIKIFFMILYTIVNNFEALMTSYKASRLFCSFLFLKSTSINNIIKECSSPTKLNFNIDIIIYPKWYIYKYYIGMFYKIYWN